MKLRLGVKILVNKEQRGTLLNTLKQKGPLPWPNFQTRRSHDTSVGVAIQTPVTATGAYDLPPQQLLNTFPFTARYRMATGIYSSLSSNREHTLHVLNPNALSQTVLLMLDELKKHFMECNNLLKSFPASIILQKRVFMFHLFLSVSVVPQSVHLQSDLKGETSDNALFDEHWKVAPLLFYLIMIIMKLSLVLK